MLASHGPVWEAVEKSLNWHLRVPIERVLSSLEILFKIRAFVRDTSFERFTCQAVFFANDFPMHLHNCRQHCRLKTEFWPQCRSIFRKLLSTRVSVFSDKGDNVVQRQIQPYPVHWSLSELISFSNSASGQLCKTGLRLATRNWAASQAENKFDRIRVTDQAEGFKLWSSVVKVRTDADLFRAPAVRNRSFVFFYHEIFIVMILCVISWYL